MIRKLRSLMTSDKVAAKSVRSTMLTFTGFGANMVLRFGSNLILTRLLVPEAFGLMALVQLVLVGMQMFSDVGLNDAIIRSKRGNDPSFLNTAWVIMIGRGFLLWLIVVAASGSIADFYGDPRLADLLPVAALGAVFGGFVTSRAASSYRNLTMGRLVLLEFLSQFVGIVIMIFLAWRTGSIWALVIGGLIGDGSKAVLSHLMIPGPRNRLQWDSSAFWELFSFGKFIFFTSILGFLVNNSDRAILGKFVSLTDLAIYNIGFMLAAVPLMLTRRVNDSVLTALYSEAYRQDRAEFHKKLARGRFALTLALMAISVFLGLIGNWLIVTLYTEPYHLAGAVLTLLCAANLPLLALLYYKSVYMGSGNPQAYMVQFLVLSILQVVLLYFGIQTYGLLGAIIVPGLSALLVYPVTAWLARRCGGWDGRQDMTFLLLSLAAAALIIWIHAEAIAPLLPGTPV